MVHVISCCVCLEGGKEDWGCLPCGHVMHMQCILRIFNVQSIREGYNRQIECPLCKRKVKTQNVLKLFLTDSVEYGDDADLPKDCDTELNTLDHVRNLQSRVSELNNTLNKTKSLLESEKEEKLHYIQQTSRLSNELENLQKTNKKQLKAIRMERDTILHDAKVLENKVANLKMELERERTYAARQVVALDLNLTGDSLIRKLRNIENSKEWFYGVLESRNKKITSLVNKLEKLERENSLLQMSSQTLQRENLLLHQDKGIDLHRRRSESAVDKQIENIPPESLGLSKAPPKVTIWDADVGVAKKTGEKRRRNEPPCDFHDEIVILDGSDDEINHVEASAIPARQSTKILSRAGPSRVAMKAAPGPSFIHKSNLATTGLEDSGTFIKRVPDGKGGWKQVYRNQPLHQAGLTRARPVSSGKTIPTFFRK